MDANKNRTHSSLPQTSRFESLFRNAVMLHWLVLIAGCGLGDSGESEKPQSSAAHSPSGGSGQPAPEADMSASEAAMELVAAKAFFEKGDLDAASKLLSKQLIKRPNDNETLLLASRVEAAKGDRETAIQLAESVSPASPQSFEATGLLVRQYLEANDPANAVNRLTDALSQHSVSPTQAVHWRHQLWALLNRMGRRQEASEQADGLCRMGRVNRELLISLLRRNESFPMVLEQEPPQKHFYPGMGLARWFFSQGEFEQALEQLSAENKFGYSSPAARALYGRLLAETQATTDMAEWYLGCDEETRKFSDYWIALGIFFFDHNQLQASARALLESIYIDPTDDDACHRLARVLAALNRMEDSAVMREQAIRVALLRNLARQLTLGQPTQGTAEEVPEHDLPEKLLTLGRPFESIGWALLGLSPSSVTKRNALMQQREHLRRNPETVNMASEVALNQIDRDDFSIDGAIASLLTSESAGPDAAVRDMPGNTVNRSPPSVVAPEFENVAAKVGVDFRWYHAKEIDLTSIPLHEMMGGGICVCDYDLDGYPDIYFGQGSGDPPVDQCTRSNRLFRNVNGHFVDVTSWTAVEDHRYSSGIAAGDVNQDGFPDLYLGALGGNRLLINNGDGTYRDSTGSLGSSSPQFTSSVAIADLTGDAIPELFECVYVEMEGAFRLPEKDVAGQELVPSPNDFYPGADRWFSSKGDGSFESRILDPNQIQPGTSLGLVITDIDSDGSNDVFVSNDARPNHLLVQFATPPIQNIADLSGLAYGFRGYSNSCMGIATGDFNRDGRFDLHVTNYIDEPNNYFLQGESGIFSDYASRYQLKAMSDPYVGFGIKALDFNRNGWLDFFVTNGHVFDQRHRGIDFQMPAQIVLNQASRFVAAAPVDPSGYLEGRYVGRSVAQIDFDRDLDLDLLVGHLDAPVALLANHTRRLGSAVHLVLVGTESERDAIGTRVVVTVDGQRFTDWVTAGDGYLCSDEPILDFGLGQAKQIDSIEVHWISGQKQVFREIAANRRYLIVEGSDDIFAESPDEEH